MFSKKFWSFNQYFQIHWIRVVHNINSLKFWYFQNLFWQSSVFPDFDNLCSPTHSLFQLVRYLLILLTFHRNSSLVNSSVVSLFFFIMFLYKYGQLIFEKEQRQYKARIVFLLKYIWYMTLCNLNYRLGENIFKRCIWSKTVILNRQRTLKTEQ